MLRCNCIVCSYKVRLKITNENLRGIVNIKYLKYIRIIDLFLR